MKKALGRITVGAAGVVVMAYLVLVVINWSDQAPSEATVRFSNLYENRPSPADTNNAYTYMLGFSAPPDTDPYELGLRRQEWMESVFAVPGFDPDSDPGSNPYNYRPERTPGVGNLAEACRREFFTGCIEALLEPESAVSQWIDSEEWLLDRYTEMIAFTGYREMPFHHRLPIPSHSDISDVRRLMFVRAWVAGESGNAELVENLLHRDLVFWRMALANSDTLISKMISVSAVIDHFRMANLIVRHHQRRGLSVRVPSSWQLEISDAERSMQQSLIGEWVLADRTLKQTFDDAQLADRGFWDHVIWRTVLPFWQPQDLSNRHAEAMDHYINLFAAPYDSIPAALGLTSNFDSDTALNASLADSAPQAQRAPEPFPRPFSRPYNLTGDFIFRGMIPEIFSGYGVRVADLEGIRRAAIAAWQLRSEEVEIHDVESRLRERQWANPYTNTPFKWDDSTSEIVFQGLRSRDGGRYAFPY